MAEVIYDRHGTSDVPGQPLTYRRTRCMDCDWTGTTRTYAEAVELLTEHELLSTSSRSAHRSRDSRRLNGLAWQAACAAWVISRTIRRPSFPASDDLIALVAHRGVGGRHRRVRSIARAVGVTLMFLGKSLRFRPAGVPRRRSCARHAQRAGGRHAGAANDTYALRGATMTGGPLDPAKHVGRERRRRVGLVVSLQVPRTLGGDKMRGSDGRTDGLPFRESAYRSRPGQTTLTLTPRSAPLYAGSS